MTWKYSKTSNNLYLKETYGLDFSIRMQKLSKYPASPNTYKMWYSWASELWSSHLLFGRDLRWWCLMRRKKITRKWLKTQLSKYSLLKKKNSDVCLYKIWKLCIQFCSLTLAKLPWKLHQLCISQSRHWTVIWKSMKSFKVTKYTCLFTTIWIQRSIHDGKGCSVFLIFCFLRCGVLHVEQSDGIDSVILTVRRQIQIHFLKLQSGSTKIWI